jgi:sirohydrochlorin ferrochelatase
MRRIPFILLILASACAPHSGGSSGPGARPQPAAPVVGVLVMAHGGGTEWNRAVAAAVGPMSSKLPTALAYGMASPYTLQAALDSLNRSGATRIAVVRMFLSGDSFLDQTEYFLGLSGTPPEAFVLMGRAATDPRARLPLTHNAEIATHADGLLVSPEATAIMVERAQSLSSSPEDESVLIVAHGMGDEGENGRVLQAMQNVAGEVRKLGFSTVDIATLREDWETARVAAETDIRAFVEREQAAGRRVIVLPMRLSGFGPYADVLSGLEYLAGVGLLPHDGIAEWVENTAADVICAAGWGDAPGRCSDPQHVR